MLTGKQSTRCVTRRSAPGLIVASASWFSGVQTLPHNCARFPDLATHALPFIVQINLAVALSRGMQMLLHKTKRKVETLQSRSALPGTPSPLDVSLQELSMHESFSTERSGPVMDLSFSGGSDVNPYVPITSKARKDEAEQAAIELAMKEIESMERGIGEAIQPITSPSKREAHDDVAVAIAAQELKVMTHQRRRASLEGLDGLDNPSHSDQDSDLTLNSEQVNKENVGSLEPFEGPMDYRLKIPYLHQWLGAGMKTDLETIESQGSPGPSTSEPISSKKESSSVGDGPVREPAKGNADNGGAEPSN